MTLNQETSTNDLDTKVAEIFNKAIKLGNDSFTVPPQENIEENPTIKPNLQHKKAFLTAANLTESSSSGSVTDSVCTAYESNQGSKFNK